MREVLEFDVVIVGAGPSGLATACRLMQQAQSSGHDLSVCVVEKGSEVGAHIVSGALFEPRALDELFPNWRSMDAPIDTEVVEDQVFLLRNSESSLKIPNALVPSSMHNRGNFIISLGNLCRWLATQAEQLGVEVFPGFAATEILYDDNVKVIGIATGDMGLDATGEQKDSFTPGIELRATYTVFAEGCRGQLGKQLIEHFQLAKSADPQHYALGFKELWQIDSDLYQPGLVIHGSGWPLGRDSHGGFFLYHGDDQQVAVGLIVDLNYQNPYLSPFDEFQRLKQHPLFKQYLSGGKRVSYGARAITKGGFNSLPSMAFPGGLVVGCNAGTLNFSKIKGSHTAMKSGMVAAEVLFDAFVHQHDSLKLAEKFDQALQQSWLYQELYRSRNFGPALHRFGTVFGSAFNFVDQTLMKGKLPFTLRDKTQDHLQIRPASQCRPLEYPKPDGTLSFDKLSSVFLSNTNHEEDQPCHLTLKNTAIPIDKHLPLYAEPAQRYCPAGVYEIVEQETEPKLQINAQNCLHCKTCDIKDPSQNITWVAPEGAGGPNYPNM